MQQQQFIDVIKQPYLLTPDHLADLEILVNEYPFFESAHLLYIKGLHKHQAINYSKQLRKTAIVVNSRSVLYELLHQLDKPSVDTQKHNVIENPVSVQEIELPPKTSTVSVTNNEIKVIYVNTVGSVNLVNTAVEEAVKETNRDEISIIQSIENETSVSLQQFDEDKLNKNIEQEINKSIVQSYIETDVIKTPELNKEELVEPSSFTEWLKAVQKEAHTFQLTTKAEDEILQETAKNDEKNVEITKKSSFFSGNKQIIDKIIENDPGRIKLGTGRFFTPAIDAKQSLLENEHLVTETLAKIYALQGNISKAIRAYEILSLKFPQKSVYFASLIEKLKTNK